MKEIKLLDKYFDLAIRESLYSTQPFLKFYLNYLFKNTTIDNKTMLDIGSGSGLFSFYAACKGANKVICIEPEAEGSNHDSIKKFKKIQSALQITHLVKLERTTIQNFDSNNKKFDIILLHHSINHLDEKACINLQHDNHAIENYKMIFEKLSKLANKGAKLIIADCSRYNFFARFNIRNPFVPMIEWHKHQPPELWAKLLSDVGFCSPEIRWTTFNPLYSLGRILLSNKIASYLLTSEFCLSMHKR